MTTILQQLNFYIYMFLSLPVVVLLTAEALVIH